MKPAEADAWNLRAATAGDCRTYWEWANDPQVRAMAFHSEPIPWEGHCQWFERRLASPSSHLFVLEDAEGRPLGQVRFDAVADGVFEIDVSVGPGRRGGGVGRVLIARGEAALRGGADGRMCRALVKPCNAASLALFRSSGYQERGMVSGPGGQEAILLEKLL